mmetsp:Transcript_49386/g.120532  ORF Transcript_49386/g.120532 Transcript_49386/m.120532 type:complete len:204 (+) Transcript_49386:1578-2189(+)
MRGFGAQVQSMPGSLRMYSRSTERYGLYSKKRLRHDMVASITSLPSVSRRSRGHAEVFMRGTSKSGVLTGTLKSSSSGRRTTTPSPSRRSTKWASCLLAASIDCFVRYPVPSRSASLPLSATFMSKAGSRGGMTARAAVPTIISSRRSHSFHEFTSPVSVPRDLRNSDAGSLGFLMAGSDMAPRGPLLPLPLPLSLPLLSPSL